MSEDPMLKRLFERIRSSPDHEPEVSGGPELIVVGLGNPGSNYASTRHNVGFMTIDQMAKRLPLSRERQRFQSILLETTFEGRRIVLAKPLTYMNRSGIAVDQLRQWYKVALEDMLIVHDDLDLPFGRIRLRSDGGDGGHNGISSVIESVGARDFPRLRIGIGRPTTSTTINFVLKPFNEQERDQLPRLLDTCVDAVGSWIQCGISEAMNEYNRRVLSPRTTESSRDDPAGSQ